MSYEEKGTWVLLVVSVAVYAVYAVIIGALLATTPVAEIQWVRPMLWAIGISIVAGIVLRILVEVIRPSEGTEADVRDKDIDHFGTVMGTGPLTIAAVGAIVLLMLDVDGFWAANLLYLGFAVQSILMCTAKLVAYRRGLPASW
jgi:hypothetical protein